MKYGGTLLIVDDMEKSKYFYETILEQKVLMDLGEHVSLDNGLSLQANYEAMIGKSLNRKTAANNFQLGSTTGRESWRPSKEWNLSITRRNIPGASGVCGFMILINISLRQQKAWSASSGVFSARD